MYSNIMRASLLSNDSLCVSWILKDMVSPKTPIAQKVPDMNELNGSRQIRTPYTTCNTNSAIERLHSESTILNFFGVSFAYLSEMITMASRTLGINYLRSSGCMPSMRIALSILHYLR